MIDLSHTPGKIVNWIDPTGELTISAMQASQNTPWPIDDVFSYGSGLARNLYLDLWPSSNAKLSSAYSKLSRSISISDAEYFNIHNRPGSSVAMGQYGPYIEGVGITEKYGFRSQALALEARTLGTYEAIPGYIRELGGEAIVWWEMKYLYEAEHIYFFRTDLKVD